MGETGRSLTLGAQTCLPPACRDATRQRKAASEVASGKPKNAALCLPTALTDLLAPMLPCACRDATRQRKAAAEAAGGKPQKKKRRRDSDDEYAGGWCGAGTLLCSGLTLCTALTQKSLANCRA